ncbi:unnamed protein product [Pedinophyceae sp. YPF-701]|nr:unnamed protein product [Pedinophyceae sp. YPF-701]
MSLEAVRDQAWQSRVLVALTLGPEEVAAADVQTFPFYTLLPYNCPIIAAAQEALATFESVLLDGPRQPWLEFHGDYLPWHVPAGVVHRALTGGRAYPWSLTVRFRSPPPGQLPQFGNDPLLTSTLNALKEASMTLTGTARPVMALPVASKAPLAAATREGQRAKYDELTSSFVWEPKSWGSRPASVPVHAYVVAGSGGVGPADCWSDVRLASRPFAIEHAPDTDREQSDTEGADSGHDAGQGARERTVGDVALALCEEFGLQASRGADGSDAAVQVVVCGVELPLSTTLEFAWAALRSPSGFLDLVIIGQRQRHREPPP